MPQLDNYIFLSSTVVLFFAFWVLVFCLIFFLQKVVISFAKIYWNVRFFTLSRDFNLLDTFCNFIV